MRNGPASSIYPAVYHDLVHWCRANGFQTSGPGRDIWIHEIDDISQVDEQVFETQLPFTRPEPHPPKTGGQVVQSAGLDAHRGRPFARRPAIASPSS